MELKENIKDFTQKGNIAAIAERLMDIMEDKLIEAQAEMERRKVEEEQKEE